MPKPRRKKQLKGRARREFLERMARGRKKAAQAKLHSDTSASRKPKAPGRSRRRRGAGHSASKGKRQNETLMTLLANPRHSKAMRGAVAHSEEFHGAAPDRVSRIPESGIYLSLGRADEIHYSPSAGARRGAWYHRFGQDARLAVRVDDNGDPVPGELAIFYDGEFDPAAGIRG